MVRKEGQGQSGHSVLSVVLKIISNDGAAGASESLLR